MIRLLTTADTAAYQAVKLLSLETNPRAFLSSYEREKLYPPSFYTEKIRYSTQPPIFGIYGLFLQKNPVSSTSYQLKVNSYLVGIAQLSQEYHLKKQHLVNIYDLYIIPASRHQGLATRLLTHLVQVAKTYPVLEQLSLWCNSDNVPAIKLYTSLGFHRIATRLRAVKETDGTYQDELQFLFSLN